MEINTKYFDRLSFTKDEIILFPEGLFGFENFKEYILIRFDNESDSLLCLQSIEEVSLAFVIVNPFAFKPDYAPKPKENDLKSLGTDKIEDVNFYNICVMRDKMKDSTVNLKCPIIVNPERQLGKQIILDSSEYTFKIPFSELMKEEV